MTKANHILVPPDLQGICGNYFSILSALATGAEVEDVVPLLLELTEAIDGCEAAAVLLASEGAVRLTGSRGLSPEASRCLGAGLPVEAQAVAPRFFDPSICPCHFKVASDGRRWCWCYPLLTRMGEFLGGIYLYFDSRRTASDVEASVLRSLCAVFGESIDRANLMRELSYRSTRDSITGLFNRSSFDRYLGDTLTGDRPAALFKVNLDRFSLVNDLLGHETGDVLLRAVAERIGRVVHYDAFLARTGGDTFGLLLEGDSAAEQIGWDVIRAFEAPFDVAESELRITASIGLARYPRDGADPLEVERNADHAVAAAKTAGRNTLKEHSEAWAGGRGHQLRIEHALRGALDRDEFELRFQPLIRTTDQSLKSYEVLLRWRHPELGSVSPAVFMPVAERSGAIVPIGLWVLQEACRLRKEWSSVLEPDTRVAVNVSPVQFNLPDFPDCVMDTLAAAGLPPSMLEIELTESSILNDPSSAMSRMALLRSRGVAIAIDDFGTGYSSLATLRDLPCDTLKLDKSFLPELQTPETDKRLFDRVVEMARALGKRIVVEGIETRSQFDYIKMLQCDVAQGYLFSRPVPGDEFLAKFASAHSGVAAG